MTAPVRSPLTRAIESLFRAPGFTLAAVLTLALGMGGALAIFAALHGAVLRTPPYPHPEQIHRVWLDVKGEPLRSVSAIPVREMAAASPDVEAVAAYTGSWGKDSLLETPGGRVKIPTAYVDPGVLPMLGLAPRLGAAFAPEHYASGEGVILTHAFWKQQLGGDPGVVGRSLPLLGQPQPILGVLPPGAELPFRVKACLLRPLPPLEPDRRGEFRFTALVRLRAGADAGAVRAVFQRVHEQQLRDYPRDTIEGARPRLDPLRTAMAGEAGKGFLLVCVAAGLLLLLATVNVAALFLDRAARRAGDVAVHLSLGATGRHLLARSLPESLVVTGLAAVLGLVLAAQIGDLMRVWLPGGEHLHGLGRAWAHPAVTLFALGLVLALGLALGLLPVLQARRMGVEATLRSSGSPMRASRRVRDGLVVVQLALATLLLFGVGLLGHSLLRLVGQPLGFDPKGLVVVELEARQYGTHLAGPDPSALVRTLQARPGIRGAAACGHTPGAWGEGFEVQAGFSAQNFNGWGTNVSRDAATLDESRQFIGVDAVSQGFTETLGLPLREGRSLTADDLATRRRVCVIDEGAARRFFPDGALGRTLYLGLWCDYAVPGGLKRAEPLEVVGVVGSFANLGVEGGSVPCAFLPATLFPPSGLLLRTGLGERALRAELEAALAQDLPGLRVRSLQTLQGARWEAALPQRQLVALLLPFGAIALLLAALGLGTLMGSQVSQRTRELGIRAALGAAPSGLLKGVLARALVRAAIGAGLGLLLSLALARTLDGLIFGVTAADPSALVGALSVLLATALAAAILPALRAARVAPAEALRSE